MERVYAYKKLVFFNIFFRTRLRIRKDLAFLIKLEACITIGANNFVDKNPFLINWAPMESQDSQLSIDTKIIENGALSTKL